MPLYNYCALNELGRKIRGALTAANELDLEERLSGLGLDLISFNEANMSKKSLFSKVTTDELIIVCVHLQQLEKAGVPILDSIVDLRDSSDSPALKTLMTEIFESVKGGKLLSEALKEHPNVFESIFTGLISVGERTGELHAVFSHLADHLRWTTTIKKKVKKATYYPMFLLVMMLSIATMMMVFVIPKLSSFLLAQSFELPGYTKALISTSAFFSSYWYLTFLVPVSLYVAVRLLCHISAEFRYNMDALKLALPWIGPTLRKIELARFCRFFGLTFKSGLGVIDCLDVSHEVISNLVIRDNIATVKKSITEGNSLTESLRITSQLPSLVIRMFKVGEESGNLDQTLENVNYFYDREVTESVDTMIAVIQPTLTLIMGALMFWISISVFGPLYNSFSNMNF